MPVAMIVLLCTLLAAPTWATIIRVNPGESIQAAIGIAQPGDVVSVAAGDFNEDLDFLGKAITVVGSGPGTVVRGTGSGPVITMASGETAASVLDSVTVTGGVASSGGGIRIVGASPIILRSVIAGNRASVRGSGVYIEASTAALYNNLIVYNGAAGGGDPHSIEISNAAPRVVNNTIARGDSNGILTRGATAALILNNVIAYNGAVTDGERRGRGICDFSPDTTSMAYNVFHKNRIGALLTDGRDFRRIRGAQQSIAPPRLEGNDDGRPFARRPERELATAAIPDDFLPRTTGNADAIDAGHPDPAYDDRDGTRNDAGFTGGPFAAD